MLKLIELDKRGRDEQLVSESVVYKHRKSRSYRSHLALFKRTVLGPKMAFYNQSATLDGKQTV